MLIIVDKKLSAEAKEKLATYGELMELETKGVTYDAISGHPDIFFCQMPDKLFVAPNLPEEYIDQLRRHNIDFITGELPVGREYPGSARYNAVATEKYLIHNFRHTDFKITRTLEDHELIHVDQGYCRCNLLLLKDDHFITSDEGILKVLKGLHPLGRYLLVSSSDILLEGFPHGFFGGCCGVWQDKVFINGSLGHFIQGEEVRRFLGDLNYEIIEMADGPMVDAGSIFFVE